MTMNNLTYLQKVALDGEIAFAIATSNHDDEVILRMYSILTSVEKEEYPYILDSFEELSNIPVEKIQRVRAEIALGRVPVWIWENKVISDLKECIKLSDSNPNQSSTSANQKTLKFKLIESAFIFFIRKITMLSPYISKNTCLRVLNENDLRCLHQACSYLLEEIKEFPLEIRVTKETFKKLLEEHFDLRDTLSYKIETKALNMLLAQEKNKNQIKTTTHENFKIKSIKNIEDKKPVVEQKNTFEAAFNELIQTDEIFQAIFQTKNTQKPKEYIVKKIFKSSGKEATLETFRTKKEAESFIKDIITNMPELLQTCTFVIEHQI